VSWWELRADVPRGLAEAAAGLLFELGASGVEEAFRDGEAPPPRQPWDRGPAPPQPLRLWIKGWFENPDADAVRARLLRGLGPQCEAAWSPVAEVDWEEEWKASFPPLHISERLTIAAPWHAIPGAIIVDPGQGFGTGQHETTRGALHALDRLPDHHGSALDLGCGSGILAIAAAHLGFRATGVDIDPVAVADAQRNAERNQINIAFSCTPIPECEPSDVVLANLHAELLVHYAADLRRLTQRSLIVAGVLADRESVVRDAFDPHFVLAERNVDGEWVCLRYDITA
jgi:ribosomal protein L11 methyltransferase